MCILTLLATSQFAFGATILIPTTCFDPYTSLEEYFAYLYPWGSDHNGSAQTVGNSSDHEYISALPLSQSPSLTVGGNKFSTPYLMPQLTALTQPIKFNYSASLNFQNLVLCIPALCLNHCLNTMRHCCR